MEYATIVVCIYLKFHTHVFGRVSLRDYIYKRVVLLAMDIRKWRHMFLTKTSQNYA